MPQRKKKIPEKENILIVSGGKINAVHQTVDLKSQGRLENELEAELIHTLDEGSNIHEFCWLQLLLWKLKESDRFMARCGGTTGNGLRRLCRALSGCKELWGGRRRPKGNTETGTNKIIKDAEYYTLLDKSHCDSGFICLLINIPDMYKFSCFDSVSY